jgi:hypothetical protein
MRNFLLAAACALIIAGCGGKRTPAPAAPAIAAQEEAISRVGDITIRASALPTAALSPEVALVGVRQGADLQETSLPAKITATATNLSGQRQEIVLRELRSGDPSTGSGQALLDYVGTVETSLPDTLRFDLTIVREGGASSTLQFSREFYPR